jgi:hypothetical protein
MPSSGAKVHRGTIVAQLGQKPWRADGRNRLRTLDWLREFGVGQNQMLLNRH